MFGSTILKLSAGGEREKKTTRRPGELFLLTLPQQPQEAKLLIIPTHSFTKDNHISVSPRTITVSTKVQPSLRRRLCNVANYKGITVSSLLYDLVKAALISEERAILAKNRFHYIPTRTYHGLHK